MVPNEVDSDLTFFAGGLCLWHSRLSPVYSPGDLRKLHCLPDLETEPIEGSLVRLLQDGGNSLLSEFS